MGRKKLDLVGQRFGRLTVIEEAGRSGGGNMIWLCKCDCGNKVTVRSNSLKMGSTKSCGCYQRECAAEVGKRSTKHGMHKTRLYQTWLDMLKRTDPTKGVNNQTKRAYQDRGINVCDEWKTIENFRDWALSHGYRDDLQIDRIDNDKGYTPENCRWVTPKENTNNRRNTIRLEDGTSLAMFCSRVGIQTRENGRISNQYRRILEMYRKYHKAHPELLAKANEAILLYRKCVELRKLIADVKHLRQTLNTK